jgi:hypothetical protein
MRSAGTFELAVEVEDVVISGHDNGLWELRHFKQFSNQLFINLHATVIPPFLLVLREKLKTSIGH